MKNPVISIVTPSYNQGQYLDECLDSILSQNYSNLELVVVDGGSTDNSVEIIQKYSKHLKWWVSEKDKGQSDAINKGIAQLNGQLFNWINSDDILLDGALNKISEVFLEHSPKVISGKTKRFEAIEDILEPVIGDNVFKTYAQMTYNQHGTFYSLDFIKSIGGVNPNLHYCMDKEIWIKYLLINGLSGIQTLDYEIAGFRIQKDSKTSNNSNNFDVDYADMLHDLLGDDSYEIKEILSNKYQLRNESYFDGIDSKIDKNLSEFMALVFLLNHSYLVYNKEQFELGKRLIELLKPHKENLFEPHSTQYNLLLNSCAPKTWFQFKIRRKLNHLYKRN